MATIDVSAALGLNLTHEGVRVAHEAVEAVSVDIAANAVDGGVGHQTVRGRDAFVGVTVPVVVKPVAADLERGTNGVTVVVIEGAAGGAGVGLIGHGVGLTTDGVPVRKPAGHTEQATLERRALLIAVAVAVVDAAPATAAGIVSGVEAAALHHGRLTLPGVVVEDEGGTALLSRALSLGAEVDIFVTHLAERAVIVLPTLNADVVLANTVTTTGGIIETATHDGLLGAALINNDSIGTVVDGNTHDVLADTSVAGLIRATVTVVTALLAGVLHAEAFAALVVFQAALRSRSAIFLTDSRLGVDLLGGAGIDARLTNDILTEIVLGAALVSTALPVLSTLDTQVGVHVAERALRVRILAVAVVQTTVRLLDENTLIVLGDDVEAVLRVVVADQIDTGVACALLVTPTLRIFSAALRCRHVDADVVLGVLADLALEVDTGVHRSIGRITVAELVVSALAVVPAGICRNTLSKAADLVCRTVHAATRLRVLTLVVERQLSRVGTRPGTRPGLGDVGTPCPEEQDEDGREAKDVGAHSANLSAPFGAMILRWVPERAKPLRAPCPFPHTPERSLHMADHLQAYEEITSQL